ncbi:beta-1,3-glucanase family protein [Homoserinibacter sp. YIM 151385]|uniref:beta-1,3-glucanase family protein n=1 Tax=Homoserinibacter sp. YIM 151385 TaxID=2985506 RepID=UPI0022F121CA|nr:beta-1,3-glucanase family protein [Homoserinibacter sp. YIM 151385]WBU37266.1 beta-1,3-glucanase family protein [Homoserinibacter sp. YIM 151385]
MGGLTRRGFLGTAALGAVGAFGLATGGGLLAPAPARAAGLPITIRNLSGAYENQNVWVHVVGTRIDTGQQGHVDLSGAFVPASLGDNSGPGGTAVYGFPLTDWGTIQLPQPMSGRIYLSLGERIPFKVVDTAAGPGIAHPAGWVESDPSFGILYDSFEFTHQNGAMYCNSTQVDMFSVPIAIRLQGVNDQTVGAMKPGGRAAFFDTLRNTEGFSGLVVDDRRVIAPSHGIGAGRFSGTYFDGYIAESWDRYSSAEMSVDTGIGQYRLRRDGGSLVAFQGGTERVRFERPSTSDVLFCNGKLDAPNDGLRGPIAAILGAALNRSTMRDITSQPTTDPSQFYRQPITNHYAAATHVAHSDGRAYGFAFDDVAAFASYIEDGAASAVELTIEPL